MLHPDFWAGLFLCSTWKKLRTMAAEDPAYLEVAEAMEKTHLEDPEVSPARYHDRDVATMRGAYATGYEAALKELLKGKDPALLAAEIAQIRQQQKQIIRDKEEELAKAKAALAIIKALEKEALAKYNETQAE